MGLRKHPFFKMIELAAELQKRAVERVGKNHKHSRVWGIGKNTGRAEFLLALRGAHPFVMDKRVTVEKVLAGRDMIDFSNFVEEFSLPFKTTLYLATNAPTYFGPLEGQPDIQAGYTLCGYLIQEQSPEYFMVWEVKTMEFEGNVLPYINQFNIDLKSLLTGLAHAEALGFEIFNKTTEAHVFKETCVIFHITNSISVKRIGIEKSKSFSIKTGGSGSGFTSVKMDNIIHIADKVEYEFTKPADECEINWDYQGFWRGHWRAFYVKDSSGNSVTNRKGWNVVDYGRVGKNRQGEYVVPGYTWVSEHTKGNPELAEIKQRVLKHK